MGNQIGTELPFHEVRTSSLRLWAVLEHTLVVDTRLLQQALDALLALDLAGLGRRQLLVFDRYAIALGKALNCLGKVAGLEFHHELEDIATDAAAEAVVELLCRLDRETRGLLIVERAARHRTDALLAHLPGARRDELDEIGALAHLLHGRAVDAASHV